MNILVCIKIEPDLSMLSASDWQGVMEGESACPYARRQLSHFDQSAAEMALSLSGHLLTLITVGNVLTQPVLKSLLALDFHKAVRVEPGLTDLRFRPDFVATQLADFHFQHPQSAIILGPQSSEGQNRQTGYLLAEMLGWPCVAQVFDIQPAAGDGLLTVCRHTGDTRQTLTLRPPVILITSTGSQERLLRIPTLQQKLAAAGKPLEVIPAREPHGASARNLTAMSLINTRRAGVVIEGENHRQKVRELYHHYLIQRWFR